MLIKYVLISAYRNSFILALLGAIFLCYSVSSFLGSTLLIEQDQFAKVFFASSVRLVVVFGFVVFISNQIRAAFEAKHIEMWLSKPISRTEFILSYFIAYGLISVLLCFLIYVLLGFNFIFVLALIMELHIVIAFTLAAAFVFNKSILSIMAAILFYILGRMSGYLMAVEIDQFINNYGSFGKGLYYIFNFIISLFPRFDLYANSILSYASLDFIFQIGQYFIYIFILFLIAAIDFNKKEF